MQWQSADERLLWQDWTTLPEDSTNAEGQHGIIKLQISNTSASTLDIRNEVGAGACCSSVKGKMA